MRRSGQDTIDDDAEFDGDDPVQGEVVSEVFDVDEVEEAFAKMRRAAGVSILAYPCLCLCLCLCLCRLLLQFNSIKEHYFFLS